MLKGIAPRLSALFARPRDVSAVEAQMRRDWDDRARENALYYIVTDAADSEEQFAASGDQSVRDIIKDVEPPVRTPKLPSAKTGASTSVEAGPMQEPSRARAAQ